MKPLQNDRMRSKLLLNVTVYIVVIQKSCQPQEVHHLMPQRYNMRSKLFCSCLCAKNGTPGAVLGTSTMTCQDSSMSARTSPVSQSLVA